MSSGIPPLSHRSPGTPMAAMPIAMLGTKATVARTDHMRDSFGGNVERPGKGRTYRARSKVGTLSNKAYEAQDRRRRRSMAKTKLTRSVQAPTGECALEDLLAQERLIPRSLLVWFMQMGISMWHMVLSGAWIKLFLGTMEEKLWQKTCLSAIATEKTRLVAPTVQTIATTTALGCKSLLSLNIA